MIVNAADAVHVIGVFFRPGIVPDRAARDTTCCYIALPAWVGFIFTEHNHKINASLKRIKSYGYIDRIITIDELISESLSLIHI